MFLGNVHHFSALSESQVRQNRSEFFVPIFQVAPRELRTNTHYNLYHSLVSYFEEATEMLTQASHSVNTNT